MQDRPTNKAERARHQRATRRVLAIFGVALAIEIAVGLAWPALRPQANLSEAAGRFVTLNPVADTYVDNSQPTTSFGSAGQIVVDAAPIRETYLKFQLGNLPGSPASAVLRVHTTTDANAGSPSGGTIATMSNTTWSEAATWSQRPTIDGPIIATIGPVGVDQWYEVDVSAALSGAAVISLGLRSVDGDGAYYASRESGLLAPQLVVGLGPPAVVLVGAGDIADCGGSGDEATANLLDAIPGTVFTLGDNVYPNGTAAEYVSCYGPSWGRQRDRTRPALGNHEYNTAGAIGYFGYFTAGLIQRLKGKHGRKVIRARKLDTLAAGGSSPVGDPTQGWYSYDVGNWHAVVLNSNCGNVGGCGAGSAQEQWLRQDLAAHPAGCTLAYWHHPLFSSGASHGGSTATKALFQALYDANAELVLVGHEHNYERFGPQNPNGQADSARGIREFVVGTGGESHYGFAVVSPNSEVRNSDTFGVLKLTLRATGYDWQFVPEAGKSFSDSGSGGCH